MHGIIAPVHDVAAARDKPQQRFVAWCRAHIPFLSLVIVPSLLVSFYYIVVASNQYEAEAHIVVRSSEAAAPVSSGLGTILGLAGSLAPSSTESMSVADYMTSHDAVDALRQKADLVALYNRSGVDPLSRMNDSDPTPEKLLKFFRRQTEIEYNRDTGITVMKVRAFSPQDAYRIANTLLALGDQRVNSLNMRGYEDAVANSRRQLTDAERALEQAQVGISRFRATSRDIDPEGTGRAQTAMVTNMTQALSNARAQLASMAALVSTSSPQYKAAAARVQALAAQLAAQSGRLAGGGKTIAASVANYNELQLRQEFASKRYEAAATALQAARQQALRKQLYLVRVVEPNMPVKSLYPERLRIILTVVLALLTAYGIGWLIVAGVKEHSA